MDGFKTINLAKSFLRSNIKNYQLINNIMKKRIYLSLFIFFFCLFISPDKIRASDCLSSIRAEYEARGLSGSGLENEAIYNCTRDQRIQDQRARDQLAADATHAQEIFKIKLDYFYKLDGIEKQYDAAGSSNSSYTQCRLSNSDCLQGARIPSDPTSLDFDVFVSLLGSKERCVTALLQCSIMRETPPPAITPSKSQDQICSEKFGQNFKWVGGTTCGCKDGYVRDSGSGCIVPPVVPQNISSGSEALRGQIRASNIEAEIAYQKALLLARQKAEAVAPTKTNDQICQDEYGKNSIWGGDKNNEGGLICDCKVGYQFNSNSTVCVLTPKITPVVPKLEKKIKAPDINNKSESGASSTATGIDGIVAILKIPGAFRECPGMSCEVIRYYAETAEVSIISIDGSGDWYQVKARNDNKEIITGWMSRSLFAGDFRDQLKAISNSKQQALIQPEVKNSSTTFASGDKKTSFWSRFRSFFGL